MLPINNKVAPQPVEDDDDADYGYGGDDGDDGAIFPAGRWESIPSEGSIWQDAGVFVRGGSQKKNCHINERHVFCVFFLNSYTILDYLND